MFALEVGSKGNSMLMSRNHDSEALGKFMRSNWHFLKVGNLWVAPDSYSEEALCHLSQKMLGLTHHFPLPVTSPAFSKLICKAFLPSLLLHLDCVTTSMDFSEMLHWATSL